MNIHPARMFFSTSHPLLSALDFEFLRTDRKCVEVRVQAPKQFSREDGRAHSGFATLVLDTVMGGTVMGSLEKLMPLATINLATHHLAPFEVGDWLRCSAHLVSMCHDVGVVDGVLELENKAGLQKVALSQGSFMIGTRATSAKPKTENGQSDIKRATP